MSGRLRPFLGAVSQKGQQGGGSRGFSESGGFFRCFASGAGAPEEMWTMAGGWRQVRALSGYLAMQPALGGSGGGTGSAAGERLRADAA